MEVTMKLTKKTQMTMIMSILKIRVRTMKIARK